MSVRRIDSLCDCLNNLFIPKMRKGFSLDGDRTQMVRNHSKRVSDTIEYSVDEAILGNKKHVVITRRDSSESPILTTITRREKGYENGKRVYCDTETMYETQPYMGNSSFLDWLFNG